ncbi:MULTISPECIES: acyl carrier protein [unclassified Streptomyces]|uniref:acyl carrier protein n=1 Tax=unclassified Streptomyces TaxID=2593676 RepID=UPI002DDAA540|nr:acyl carrier protein [Streptomyces sp. NBC_01750]WSB04717.1 acyl carrier protein [Streptomyces sp. NBC_01794]WSD31003.1 acyl carrier protein [Streptomyces sp. NBC_01750]
MHIVPETRPQNLDIALSGLTAPDLEQWLTERVAFHLHRSADEIDPTTPLADYGIDSVAAIGICGEIEERHQLPVSPTIAYDFPTVRAISAHLAERLADGSSGGGAS